MFDDLSSALGTSTESELWARCLRGRDVTCLVVSHSPIALARAHRVLVVEDGRIAADHWLSRPKRSRRSGP